MKLSQKTCLRKERIDFFGLKKDMSQGAAKVLRGGTRICGIRGGFRRLFPFR